VSNRIVASKAAGVSIIDILDNTVHGPPQPVPAFRTQSNLAIVPQIDTVTTSNFSTIKPSLSSSSHFLKDSQEPATVPSSFSFKPKFKVIGPSSSEFSPTINPPKGNIQQPTFINQTPQKRQVDHQPLFATNIPAPHIPFINSNVANGASMSFLYNQSSLSRSTNYNNVSSDSSPTPQLPSLPVSTPHVSSLPLVFPSSSPALGHLPKLETFSFQLNTPSHKPPTPTKQKVISPMVFEIPAPPSSTFTLSAAKQDVETAKLSVALPKPDPIPSDEVLDSFLDTLISSIVHEDLPSIADSVIDQITSNIEAAHAFNEQMEQRHVFRRWLMGARKKASERLQRMRERQERAVTLYLNMLAMGLGGGGMRREVNVDAGVSKSGWGLKDLDEGASMLMDKAIVNVSNRLLINIMNY
jgi:hypothetical protein